MPAKKRRGAGRYRHKLLIEQNCPKTVNRQRVDDWRTYVRRSGSLRPLRAVERYINEAHQEVLISHTIRLRFDSKTAAITESHRVVYSPGHNLPKRYFAIKSAIDPDERRREIELHVIERAFER